MNGTLNKVMLIGNVGDEIKVHQFDDQNKIGRFPLATSESFTSKETGEKVSQTEWHNIVVRGTKLVEIFEKYVKKGDKLYIEGKLKSRKWQDSNNQDRYTTEIVVSDFTFLTTKGNSSNEGSSYSQSAPPSQSSQDHSHNAEEPHDDLPF